ncbi:MAG TPA: hypothetical protein VFX77_02380, partial [Rubrobacter sp.]|nr:hypothetical protein [Rubrobacter sp.]
MKLMKTTLRKLWRLTRTTSTIVGLAVMVGLVAGAASLAVAQKSPSGGTTSSPLLKGVENVAATTTTLINSGRGAAMSMHVQPGNAPLTVNDDAGTATNLSADQVDGKDSTAFVSATNGKAPDSELLDGKDSTEFLGAAAKAADSDKLDGKDSTDFAAASIGTVYTDRTDQVRIPNDGDIDVVTMLVPPGSYVINAKVSLENMDDDDSAFVGCDLHAGGNRVDMGSPERLSQSPRINAPDSDTNISESYPLQAVVRDFGGESIRINC